MDNSVLRAMAKWPDVPAVFGWLALDRRGQWWVKQERVSHALSKAFIERNYQADARGCWFFQNGPQRVYVTLAETPWVYQWRDGAWWTHIGVRVVNLVAVWLDENGSLFFETEWGIGVVDDRDLIHIHGALCQSTGVALSDLQEASLLAPSLAVDLKSVRFRWQDQLVALGFIANTAFSGRFDFQRQPKPETIAGVKPQ